MFKTSILWNLQSFLEKNQRLQHQIQHSHQKFHHAEQYLIFCNFKKSLDFMAKTSFVFGSLPFFLGVVLTTWLHLGAPQKLQEK